MGFFRSEQVNLYNLVIPRESAWSVLNELGQINTIHVVDEDDTIPQMQRPFANYIKRCDELLVKIQFLISEISNFDKKIHTCEDEKEILRKFNLVLKKRDRAPETFFQSLEQTINEKHDWLHEQLQHYEHLVEGKNNLVEQRAVLLKTKSILGYKFFNQGNQEQIGYDYSLQNQTFGDLTQKGVSMNHITGVIDKVDANRFKRMVFRVTKGNVWTDILDIDERLQGEGEQIIDVQKRNKRKNKAVFVVLYPGGRMDTLKQRLERLCDSFGASIHDFPTSQREFTDTVMELDKKMIESKELVSLTEDSIIKFLDSLCGFEDEYQICSFIEELRLYVQKEKALYVTMNMFKVQDQYVQGHVWVPVSMENQTQKRLLKAGESHTNQNVPLPQLVQNFSHKLKPPTYIPTNDFTQVFQQIVDTYGVPRYLEVNPGMFTCLTFPFLFGVMFGDIGHGFALFVFGLYLVFRKDSILDSPTNLFKPMIPARYLFTLMGFFACYCGFIYNDFLSLKLNLFDSCYDGETKTPWGDLAPREDCTYPFGIDPVWALGKNELAAANSLKMKLSVIIGVIQMSFGICLKAVNAFHFKEKLDFFFEFIPQILFMCCTFLYMDIMIIVKWTINYSADTSQAPSIISMLINMPLKSGDPGEYPLYEGQQGIQIFLLTIALICVPMMLIPKPILKFYFTKKNQVKYSEMFRKHSDDGNIERNMNLLQDQDNRYAINIELQNKNNDSELQSDLEHDLHDDHQELHDDQYIENHTDEDESFGEIFVHQIIETIEFVLGSISNTASYLRLWALSLAHSQLAKVFFDKILKDSIVSGSWPGLIIGFVIFYGVTLGVLMCMDVMECFLHALRLHWVEFQNKFYKADGYKFAPFSFLTSFKENKLELTQPK